MQINNMDDLKSLAGTLGLAVLPGFHNWVHDQMKRGQSWDDLANTIRTVAQQMQ